MQRRLLEGNIPRLRGEARDPAAHVRSPLADNGGKDGGPADGNDESADDSSAEESDKSLQSDADGGGDAAAASERTRLTALLVHCKVSKSHLLCHNQNVHTSRFLETISLHFAQTHHFQVLWLLGYSSGIYF